LAAQIAFVTLFVACEWSQGCGSGGGSSSVLPPPPSIVVTVAPKSGSVLLGDTTTFTANVTNTIDTGVIWSVNGTVGGSATQGTITPDGMYTAPADLPSPSTVQVTATSHADATKSDTASLTITSDITLALTPNPASVELGANQRFAAVVASGGHPDTAVRWSVSGAACPGGCGTVDASGNYTAPPILPSNADVTLTAQSGADSSKQISAAVTITSTLSLQLSAPASVPAGTTGTIVATLTLAPGSAPSNVLAWSLSGPGCSGASCGTLNVVTTQSVGGNAVAQSATYTAPVVSPNPNSVTVTVTSQADPSTKAQAVLAIQAGVGMSLTPLTATLAANHRVTLTVQVNGTSNAGLLWSVNGIAGGNGSLGQICVAGSNPCQTITSKTSLQVYFLAPGAIPSPNPVTVTAASAADSTRSASAQITVINHVAVSVQPASATLAPLSVQGFTASVLGTGNPSVVWQVQGAACSSASTCGSISANGVYTAPSAAPTPNAIQIVAISADDTSQSGLANVSNSTGAAIGATLGGWSCNGSGPAQFDGTFEIDGLAVGRSYTVYAEALNGAVEPSQFSNATAQLCPNPTTDAGWPPLQGCVFPSVETSFTTRTRPGP
jgi:hypothetical protein